jgi:hypothetical protein
MDCHGVTKLSGAPHDQDASQEHGGCNTQGGEVPLSKKFPEVTDAEWQTIQTICRKKAAQQERWRLAGVTKHGKPQTRSMQKQPAPNKGKGSAKQRRKTQQP